MYLQLQRNENLNFSIAFSFFIISAISQASTLRTPEVPIRIWNQTSFTASEFEYVAFAYCEKKNWPRNEYCGMQRLDISIASDGRSIKILANQINVTKKGYEKYVRIDLGIRRLGEDVRFGTDLIQAEIPVKDVLKTLSDVTLYSISPFSLSTSVNGQKLEDYLSKHHWNDIRLDLFIKPTLPGSSLLYSPYIYIGLPLSDNITRVSSSASIALIGRATMDDNISIEAIASHAGAESGHLIEVRVPFTRDLQRAIGVADFTL